MAPMLPALTPLVIAVQELLLLLLGLLMALLLLALADQGRVPPPPRAGARLTLAQWEGMAVLAMDGGGAD